MTDSLASRLSFFAGQSVLVTGGCGFIGSHLVDLLVSGGVKCSIVDNLFQNSRRNIGESEGRCPLYEADITDERQISEVFEKVRPAIVFHLAALHFIPYCNAHPVAAIATNIAGTQRIVDECRRHRVRRLFFASTAAVYAPSDRPHAETDPLFPTDIYGVTKLAAEQLVSILAKDSETAVTIGRYTNAVGLRETNPHILPAIRDQLRRSVEQPSLRIGNLKPKRDYIHVKDIAEATAAITCASRDEALDVVNIGTGTEISVEELIALFSAEIGQPITVSHDQERARRDDRPHLTADVKKAWLKYGWRAHTTVQQAVREILGESGSAPDVAPATRPAPDLSAAVKRLPAELSNSQIPDLM